MNEHNHRDESMLLVKNYTMLSLTPAVVPVPFLDLSLLAGIQFKLLHSLSMLYDIDDFSPQMVKASITSLVSGTIPVASSPILASLIKFIPGIGQVSGIASMLVLNGAATHALGMVFTRHFENGGNLSNFDPQAATAYFQEEFEKGKENIAKLKQQSTEKISELKTHLQKKEPPVEN